MLRLLEYVKEQDKLINKTLKKAMKYKNQEELARIFKELFIEATLLGVSTSETELELLSKRHFSERASKTLRVTLSDVKKTKSITDRASEFWDEYSLKLAGNFEKSKLEDTERYLKNLIKNGNYTRTEMMEEIEKRLELRNKYRLNSIITTETTKCYNYGRVENARENSKNGGVTKALRYHAVMDRLTSSICEARNGLVLDINDPRIDENTPPLHVNCRSMWVYVDKWDYEEIYQGRSSEGWETKDVKETKPDSSWGNPFAYGGKKENKNNVSKKIN